MKIMLMGAPALDLKHKYAADTHEVFKKLVRIVLKRKCDEVFIIGDLFLNSKPSQKDIKTAVEQIGVLIQKKVKVSILQGALSASKFEENSFFGTFRAIWGDAINLITEPCSVEIKNLPFILVPYVLPATIKKMEYTHLRAYYSSVVHDLAYEVKKRKPLEPITILSYLADNKAYGGFEKYLLPHQDAKIPLLDGFGNNTLLFNGYSSISSDVKTNEFNIGWFSYSILEYDELKKAWRKDKIHTNDMFGLKKFDSYYSRKHLLYNPAVDSLLANLEEMLTPDKKEKLLILHRYINGFYGNLNPFSKDNFGVEVSDHFILDEVTSNQQFNDTFDSLMEKFEREGV